MVYLRVVNFLLDCLIWNLGNFLKPFRHLTFLWIIKIILHLSLGLLPLWVGMQVHESYTVFLFFYFDIVIFIKINIVLFLLIFNNIFYDPLNWQTGSGKLVMFFILNCTINCPVIGIFIFNFKTFPALNPITLGGFLSVDTTWKE